MTPATAQAPDSSATQFPRAFTSPLAWLILLFTFALGLAGDLASKHYAFASIPERPLVLDRDTILANPHYQLPYVPPVTAVPFRLLDFNLVINRGAVFGLGENQRMAFVLFTLFATGAALFVFSRWTTTRDRLAHVAIGLILAGGVGNLYDRIAFAVVRDFLHLFPQRQLPFGWTWPGGNPEIFPWVFNVADVLLLTGMGLLMIHLNRNDRRGKTARTA